MWNIEVSGFRDITDYTLGSRAGRRYIFAGSTVAVIFDFASIACSFASGHGEVLNYFSGVFDLKSSNNSSITSLRNENSSYAVIHCSAIFDSGGSK